MKRVLLTAIVAIPILTHSFEAKAVIVECANCSSLAEQLLTYEKQAQQYEAEAAQLHTQLQQYQTMIQNTIALPRQIWADVQGDINQIRGLANAASLLAGNSGTILSRLQQAGYYLNSASFLPGNIIQQFNMWQTTMGNATKVLARTLGVQQGQENNYTLLQSAIQAHSQTAAGQMQAIQASTEMAGLMNTQLNQIQTTLVAAAQEQATRDEIAADRRAANDAVLTKFMDSVLHPTTGGAQY